MEPLADGLVEQDRGDGRIDAAAQAEDDGVAADLPVELIDGRVDERGGRPVAAAAADGLDEIGQDAGAVFGMIDFGVELYGVGLFAEDAVGRVDHAGRGGQHSGIVRQGRDGVAVRHPDLAFGRNSVEERISLLHFQFGPPVLARTGALDAAAVVMREVLRAVADAQQGKTPLDAAQVHLRCVRRRDGAGASGEDHALDRIVEFGDLVERMDFAVNAEFAEAASDELRHLGAEVKNNDLFNHSTKIYNYCEIISTFAPSVRNNTICKRSET